MTTLAQIEADIQAFIQKAVSEVEVIVADAIQALSNVAQMAPTIAADITNAANFIESIPGVGSNPDVQAAVTAVNIADAGLQAFAKTYEQSTTAGGSVTVTQATQAVISGYQAVKSAQAAAASATAVVTGAAGAKANPAP